MLKLASNTFHTIKLVLKRHSTCWIKIWTYPSPVKHLMETSKCLTTCSHCKICVWNSWTGKVWSKFKKQFDIHLL